MRAWRFAKQIHTLGLTLGYHQKDVGRRPTGAPTQLQSLVHVRPWPPSISSDVYLFEDCTHTTLLRIPPNLDLVVMPLGMLHAQTYKRGRAELCSFVWYAHWIVLPGLCSSGSKLTRLVTLAARRLLHAQPQLGKQCHKPHSTAASRQWPYKDSSDPYWTSSTFCMTRMFMVLCIYTQLSLTVPKYVMLLLLSSHRTTSTDQSQALQD